MSGNVTDPTRTLLAAAADGLRVFDLARPYVRGMPQSPNHPPYWHSLGRRHGDMVREDGSSSASDVIFMGTHVGTHIDALAHVSDEGRLHGGLDARQEQVGGRFMENGVHTIAPIVGRGVLVDVPRLRGEERCAPGHEITVRELEAAEAVQETSVGAGDVVLIRSGWGQFWDDGDVYVGHRTGVPGVGEAGARWLAERRVRAAGADSIAFERIEPGRGHARLPAHRVLLVAAGIPIIETLNLEELARASVHEFLFVLSPLPLVGATGSPARPLAIVGGSSHDR